MEFLKSIFGEKSLTFADFKAAIEADKKIKLVNLADGMYVDKEKLDKKIKELDAANNTITDLTNKVKDFENVDVKGLQDTIKKYEDAETVRKDAEAKATALKELKDRFAPLKGDKKFLNEGTEQWMFSEFEKARALKENDGKSDAEIFEAITKDKNIYENPNQVYKNPPAGGGDVDVDDAKARAVMGLPPLKKE